MWSFKEWLYKYRDPKLKKDANQMINTIKEDVDKIDVVELTTKKVRDILIKHGYDKRHFDTIPMIMAMKMEDMSYVHELPTKEVEDMVCSKVIQWRLPLRASNIKFPNYFILYRALQATGHEPLAEIYKKHTPLHEEYNEKWVRLILN
jgi:hypothetical protein